MAAREGLAQEYVAWSGNICYSKQYTCDSKAGSSAKTMIKDTFTTSHLLQKTEGLVG